MKTLKTIPAFAAVILSANLAPAADYTWTGNTNTDWSTAANWNLTSDPGVHAVPNLNGTDTANLGGTSIYDAANGDFALSSGSTLTINNGGSWTQTNGIAWMQMGGGTLTINSGGSFDSGSMQQINIGVGSTFNLGGSANMNAMTLTLTSTTTMNVTTGGTLTTTGNLVIDASDAVFNMTGGTVNLGEFKPNSPQDIVVLGGELNASLISFDNTEVAGVVELGDARINLSNGAFSQGIYSIGGDDYINFTNISSELFVDNLDEAGANMLITDGRLRYNDAIGDIIFAAQGDGYLFTVNAVPEPSTYAAMAGLLALGIAALWRRKS